MMMPKELADKLNNRDFSEDFTKELTEANKSNLIVAFCTSDNILEIYGCLYDAVCLDDFDYKVPFFKGKIFESQCEDIDCPNFHLLESLIEPKILKFSKERVIEANFPIEIFQAKQDNKKLNGCVFNYKEIC